MHVSFTSILVLMSFAVFSVWLFKRMNLPPILAYLACGIFAGPHLLAIIDNPEEIHFFAELGIVFLLFSLGLEFSLPKVLAMRHLVFGIGLGQMLVTTLAFMGLAMAIGFDSKAALIIGGMIALSSTAIVIKQMAEKGTLNSTRAQMVVSILLFQDLAVVPLLILVPLLAENSQTSMWMAITMAFLKGTLVVGILLSAGKWLLPRIFNEVARTRTDELFVLTTILVALIAAGLTYSFGLSMALGAFLAGMMLSESQYRHQLEADIRPFRDILMGLFFITIGMRFDMHTLLNQFHWIILGLIVIMLGKILIIRACAWFFRTDEIDAWTTGIKLSQMGEFSFVLAALAVNHEVISAEQGSLLLAIGVVSMALTPWLVDNGLILAKKLASNTELSRDPLDEDIYHPNMTDHVLILGFGRVGQSVSRLLNAEAIPYLVVDADPVRVSESRSAGEPIFFGDVAQKDILRAVGIDKAKLVLLTFDEHQKALSVIKMITDLRPGLPIVVRTRKDYHLEELYAAGASQVVPEILEGSLMLVSQVLHLSGIPMSRILKRVRSERKGHYRNMHGFFPGETTEISYGTKDKLEFLHAIILTSDAFAVGKSIDELNLTGMRINIKGLRRKNIEIATPDLSEALKVGDVVVISGKPRRVERAERFLLEGH
ncbi:monovalent cation:proton antiporter family protein [Aliiglaciecola sp. LCG003]|uniref:monovalent cation:proton antiporter family protein n=1 Tax=Aliiglaciecola sp. LCG003 TaxID=3053655 RepID=UPI0025738359|nr:monovalent cation:proton antiporter family protein [Aliiglaciecola sp. LCG003]WJG08518.1 cation:proton antiporter [Aliiglaciecola sp. LCG003]